MESFHAVINTGSSSKQLVGKAVFHKSTGSTATTRNI
jgi:hypothetical protein